MKRIILFIIPIVFALLCSCNAAESGKGEKDSGGADGAKQERSAEKSTEKPPEKSVEPQLLGEFETQILDNAPERVSNLSLACEKINGVVTEPGGEFSFNGVVGERTEARGFKKGIVFEGTKKTQAVGGGVCQVASTLFCAARNSGLEITERHQHKREVHYVKLGDDATVSYGELDFRFKNTQSRPVKTEAFVTESTVCVRIWQV